MDNSALKARFVQFNKKYFDGLLPDMPVTFANLKTMGGYFSCKVRRTKMPPSMKMVPDTAYIKLDKLFLRTDEAIEGLLLHEMIHAYLAVIGRDEVHGPYFFAKLDEVQKKSGIPIPKTEKLENLKRADKSKSIEVGVVLVETNQGTYSFALVAPARFKKEADVEALLKQWRDRVHYKLARGVSLWKIESDAWTDAALKFPIQRKALTKLSFFLGKDKDLIADLMENGTKLDET